MGQCTSDAGALHLGRSPSYIAISMVIWSQLLGVVAIGMLLYFSTSGGHADAGIPLEPFAWLGALVVLPLFWRVGQRVTVSRASLSVAAPLSQTVRVALGPSTRFRHVSCINFLRHVHYKMGVGKKRFEGSELSTLPAEWDKWFTESIEATGLRREGATAGSQDAFTPQATGRYRFLRIRMELEEGGRRLRVPPTTASMPELAAWLYKVEMSSVYPNLESRHAAGDNLQFGCLTLTSSKLRYGEQAIPLDMPIQIAVGLFRVRFWIGGQRIFRTGWMFRGTGLSVPMRRIDNICSLITLLRRQHHATFAPFGLGL